MNSEPQNTKPEKRQIAGAQKPSAKKAPLSSALRDNLKRRKLTSKQRAAGKDG